MRIFILSLGVLLLATSCVNIEFTEPQPAGKRALKTFPEKFHGTFLVQESEDKAVGEKDTIVVDATGFTGISKEKKRVSKEEVEDNPDIRIVGSRIFIPSDNTGQGLPFSIEDSGYVYELINHERANLRSDSMVLKKDKDNYFLSVREESGSYNLILLRFENEGNIAAWSINAKEEIDKLRRFTEKVEEVRNDNGKVEKYIASPTKKELRKFVDSGGFTELVYRLKRID